MNLSECFDIEQIKNAIEPYSDSKSSFLNDYRQAWENKDVGFVQGSIHSILLNKRISIDSPIDGAQSTAVSSYTNGGSNFILMETEGKEYWLLIQGMNFIDCVVYKNKLFYITSESRAKFVIHDLQIAIQNIKGGDSILNNELRGFYIHQERPYHYFYDQLKTAIFLDNKFNSQLMDLYPFYVKKSYIDESLILNNVNKVSSLNGNGLLMKTCIFSQFRCNALNSEWSKQWMEKMESELYLNNSTFRFDREDYDFVLWIGVTGQKRSWLEQIEGYSAIIKNIAIYFNNVLVVIDGWTSTHGKVEVVEEDTYVCREIERLCDGKADFLSLVGKDYSTKISVCKNVDFFIANAGTGSMIPLRVCKKNGVLHSNTKVESFPDNYRNRNQLVSNIENEHIKIDSNESKKKFDKINYSIHWTVIYDELVNIINSSWCTDLELISNKYTEPKPAGEDATKIIYQYLKFLKESNSSSYLLTLNKIHNIIERYEGTNSDLNTIKKERFFKLLLNNSNFNSITDIEILNNRLVSIKKSKQQRYVNIIREVSELFASVYELDLAKKIMEHALMLKPNGKHIKDRINEYDSLINSNHRTQITIDLLKELNRGGDNSRLNIKKKIKKFLID